MSDGQVFYKYKDAKGREIITNDLAVVPRGQIIERVAPENGYREAAVTIDSIDGSALGVHLPSAGLGLGVAAAVAGVGFVWMRARWLFRLAAVLFAIAFIGALYFGWVLRSAGLGDGVAASPTRAFEESRRAVDGANARTTETQRVLERIRE